MGELQDEELFVSWYQSRSYIEKKLIDLAWIANDLLEKYSMRRFYAPMIMLAVVIVGVLVGVYTNNQYIQMSACFAAGGALVAALMLVVYRYFGRHK